MPRYSFTILFGFILAVVFAPYAAMQSGREEPMERGAGATISGVVVDPAGRPVAGAIVRLVGERNHHWPARTDREGRFLLSVPQPGHYTVVAEKPSQRFTTWALGSRCLRSLCTGRSP